MICKWSASVVMGSTSNSCNVAIFYSSVGGDSPSPRYPGPSLLGAKLLDGGVGSQEGGKVLEGNMERHVGQGNILHMTHDTCLF